MVERVVGLIAGRRVEGEGLPEYGLIAVLFAIGILGVLHVVI
jgi:hypothetical protein